MSEENFDRIAAVYEETLPAHVIDHYLRKRVRFLAALCPTGRALDVGCGTGALAARLSAEGLEVAGIDPSAGMLEQLKARAPQVKAVKAPGDQIPFDDASFDLTFSVAAFHHIADPVGVRATLAEMVRVTRRGGHVVIWDHNPRNPYWRLLMARVPQDDGSERLIPEPEIRAGLADAGCMKVRNKPLGFVPDFVPARLMDAAARAETMVERLPLLRRLCAHNVVVAVRP